MSFFHPVPVGLVEAVFQGDDGVFLDEFLIEIDHLFSRPFRVLLGGKDILTVLIKGAGGGIEGDGYILSGFIAGLLNGLHDELKGLGITLEVGCKPALVTHACGVIFFDKDLT